VRAIIFPRKGVAADTMILGGSSANRKLDLADNFGMGRNPGDPVRSRPAGKSIHLRFRKFLENLVTDSLGLNGCYFFSSAVQLVTSIRGGKFSSAIVLTKKW
jgi:hypothetical protein